MACEAVIALGSNMGIRHHAIQQAILEMSRAGIEVLRQSFLYETAPAYVTDQPAFLNAAVLCRCQHPPSRLLAALKDIEVSFGRDIVSGPWCGPRPLDLDIIFYGNMDHSDPTLNIPHPRWRERSFVLAPLSDLADHETDDVAADTAGDVAGYNSCRQRLMEAGKLWQAQERAEPLPRTDISRVLPLRHSTWRMGSRTFVMGILNITPDSFSDGGRHKSVAGAAGAARLMVREGADVLDIGGQSTRPGAQMLSSEEEAARVIPVIRALRDDAELYDVALSIDTFYSDVAAQAVLAGADVVNDVSGGTLDPRMHAQVAELGVPYICMHMRGTPTTMQSAANLAYDSVWRDVGRELTQRATSALAAGVCKWNLVLDPGVGFAKDMSGSRQLIALLGRLRREALPPWLRAAPLLLGASRKAFLGKITGRQAAVQRDCASAAAAVAAVATGGVDIVRAHNVACTHDALRVADALLRHDMT